MHDLRDQVGAPAEAVARGLAQHGWHLCEQFLPESVTERLARECHHYWQQGQFRHAGVGAGSRWQLRPEVRSDRVCWLDSETPSPGQARYLRALEELRLRLNQAMFLGLFDYEGHLTVYPPGSFYRRHYDRFEGRPERTVSCILYLNADWQPEDGGALRLYLPQGPVDILPRSGRLVCFLSDRYEHEVLPARRERMSLTGWFKRRIG